MREYIKRFGKLTALLALFGFMGCGGNAKKEDPNHIKVGVSSGPEFKIAEAAKKVAKEKYNLEVELIAFNDYVIPNEALNQGDIDANVFQHKPYLDKQCEERGYKFAVAGNTFIFPIGAYSKKLKKGDKIENGSLITIPNDPTNGGRALLLLEKEGFIKLKDGVGITPRVIDIIENYKNLSITELEAPQLTRSLDDNKVILSIINNTYSVNAGFTLNDALFHEEKDSPYVNVIAVKEEDKDADKVKRFVEAYQSDEVFQIANETFIGGAIKGW